MRLRSRQEMGTLEFEGDLYGHSVLGTPLRVWLPSGSCRLLVHAGIHGEEGETTVALSRALRLLAEPSPHCAVILAVNPDGLALGTRGNARGVDLNRNFPTKDWRPDPVTHRSTLDDLSDVVLSPGEHAGSEPETRALVSLINDIEPEAVVALHAPLACIDDDSQGPLAAWLAEKTGLPLVSGVGYPTPGSFGTWGGERGLEVVTYELPLADIDAVVRDHVPVLTTLLAGGTPWS